MSATATSGLERIADAFAGAGKRAALMPYLMAGFPTLEESVLIGEACVAASARVPARRCPACWRSRARWPPAFRWF